MATTALSTASNSGAQNDFVTNANTITFTGQAGVFVTPFTGVRVPNEVVVTLVSLLNPPISVTPVRVQADANGNYTATLPSVLAAGSYTVTVAEIGLGLPVVPSTIIPPTLIIDRTAPAAPVVTPPAPTNDTTPVVTGTAEPGSTVTVANAAGTVLGTGVANAVTGAFSIELTPALAAGTTGLVVTARDLAGNAPPGCCGPRARPSCAAARLSPRGLPRAARGHRTSPCCC